MNSSGLTSAALTYLITLCTSLLALFTQPGVINFSNVSPVAYGTAIIGAALAAAHTYQARMKDAPNV